MADKQKENNKLQSEYNNELKQTKSLLSEIQSAMDSVVLKSDKRNKALQEFVSLNKVTLDDVTSEDKLQAKIIASVQKKQAFAKANLGINEKQRRAVEMQLAAEQGLLQKEYNKQKALESTNKAVDNISSSLNKQFDNVNDALEKIPVIGKTLSSMFDPMKDSIKSSTNQMGTAFKDKFKESFSAGIDGNLTFAKSFKNGISGGAKQVASMGKAFLSTGAGMVAAAALIGLALYKAFQMGLDRFKELEKAGRSFRDTTGLLNSQTSKLVGNIQTISRDMATLGVSAEDVAKAAADFSNEFGGIEQPSKAVLSSMVMLNKNFGIGTAEASKLNKVFQNIGGLSAEQSQFLIGQTASMAKLAGVAPQKVIADMAESSEYAYKYFKGSPKELAKAAVQAAKMGTSIAEAGKAADNLLDFQSSISKELEASAILGVNLNLSQARYAAANGDLIGQQQAINDQVAKLGDLTKLNTFEQQALADATGMEFSSLVNQQRIRERFGKLNKEQLAAATSLLDAGKDINSITDKDLQDQTTRMARQQEMQSRIEKMQNTFKALGTQISDAFAPFASIFIDIASVLGSVLVPAFKVLGSVIKFAFMPLTLFIDGLKQAKTYIMENKAAFVAVAGVMGGILGYQIAINAQKLIEFGLTGKKFIMDKASLGIEIAKNAALTIYNGILAVGNAIKKQGLLASIAEMAMRAFSSLSAIPVIGPVLGIAGAAAAAALGYSYFSQAGDVNSPADGKTRISTKEGGLFELSPNDDLIAAPGLSKSMSGGGGGVGVSVDMSGVIAELQSLKQAFLSNKDVYMDKSLVTSAVTNTQERSGRENRFGLQGA